MLIGIVDVEKHPECLALLFGPEQLVFSSAHSGLLVEALESKAGRTDELLGPSLSLNSPPD